MARECGKFVDSYLREDRDNPGLEKAVQLSTAYSCSLDSGHDGPCAARENQASMNARTRWEQNRGVLNQFQGKAVTFAEGHAEPGSMLSHPGALNTPTEYHYDQRTPKNPSNQSSGSLKSTPTYSGNPYVSAVTQEVGPPAKWIKPTPPDQPGWIIGPPTDAENFDKTPIIYETPQLQPGHEIYPAPTRANREHDQKLPTKNDRVTIQDQGITKIQKRKQIGLERYGTLLQSFNGRNSLRDAEEEVLDLFMYLIQINEERAEISEDFNYIVGLIREMYNNDLDPELIQIILKIKNWLDPKDV